MIPKQAFKRNDRGSILFDCIFYTLFVAGTIATLILIYLLVTIVRSAINYSEHTDSKDVSSNMLSMECAHGVAYVRLGWDGGITVAYNPDGSIKLCEGEKK